MAELATRHIPGRLTDTTLARYQEIKTQLGLMGRGSDEVYICTLLDSFVAQHDHEKTPITVTPEAVVTLLECTPEDQVEIQMALDLPHTDFWQLVYNGLMREVRITNTNAKKLEQFDPDNVTRNQRGDSLNRARGSTAIRIQQCVEGLMQQNVAATTVLERIYITRGIVQNLTKAHSDYVAQYFDQHAAELDAHHRQHGFLTPQDGIAHNRKRNRILKDKRFQNGDTALPATEDRTDRS